MGISKIPRALWNPCLGVAAKRAEAVSEEGPLAFAQGVALHKAMPRPILVKVKPGGPKASWAETIELRALSILRRGEGVTLERGGPRGRQRRAAQGDVRRYEVGRGGVAGLARGPLGMCAYVRVGKTPLSVVITCRRQGPRRSRCPAGGLHDRGKKSPWVSA